MARSVSLSDEAFAALRHEKQVGESDSDVVLRLRRMAHRRERDPLSFFRTVPPAELTPDGYDEVAHRMRGADAERA